MALRNLLILVALLLVACTQFDHARSGQVDSPCVVHRALTLDSLRFNWPSTTVPEVIARLGAADRDVGSGLFVLEYRLQDGSKVWLGSANYVDILYVRQGTSLRESELVYRRERVSQQTEYPQPKGQPDW
jgi:hypothetical protein